VTDILAATVRALVRACKTHQPAVAAVLPLPDAETAYAVQDGVADALGSFTAKGPGTWKSGGPSRAAALTHARLPDAGVWTSPTDARHWPFRLRGIEAEVALRVGQDVDAERAATLDLAGAIALIDAMCVSIEIVDSRWSEGLDAPPLAKLADLQSHGAVVLGAWVPFAPRDWAAQVCRVTIGTQPTIERIGTHSMTDPAFVLPAWLRHATRAGYVVQAGSVVTTGTWCGIVHAAAGDRVSVEFPGIGSAEVQL
jgi:2-keto-4-pentenoate hydratase